MIIHDPTRHQRRNPSQEAFDKAADEFFLFFAGIVTGLFGLMFIEELLRCTGC